MTDQGTTADAIDEYADADDPSGAIDSDFDDAERSAREQLLADQPDMTDPVAGGLAFDLVTRQLLFVRRRVADDLVEYYVAEDFDLLNYNEHPYLPVTIDDAVFECVFVADVNADSLDDFASASTYSYPRGRLAAVPVQEAWSDE